MNGRASTQSPFHWGDRKNKITKTNLLNGFVFLLVLSISFNAIAICSANEPTEKNNPQPSDKTVTADSDFWSSSKPPKTSGNLELGQKLFEQDFSLAKQLTQDGDGVGPVFNSASCIGCHHQGDLGGGGNVKHNVHLVSLSPDASPISNIRLALMHPGFRGANGGLVPSIMLHRHATNPEYNSFRTRILHRAWVKRESDVHELQRLVSSKPVRVIKPEKGIQLLHTQRNTPPLFGMGQIDQIPSSLLREQAAKQKRFGIQGRPSQLPKQRIGKFGWRGQLSSLDEFVLSACANELGLEVEGHKQPRDPLKIRQKESAVDLTRSDTEAMTQYVASLPAPKPDFSGEHRETALRGLNLFNKIGCAECHVRNMGPAKDIFSDLLLHDMGKGLSDPIAASREIDVLTTPNSTGKGVRTFIDEPRVVNMYYTGTVLIPQFTKEPNVDPNFDVVEKFAETDRDPRQEWRTPPLWGCADSAPYLHDGRAATLTDAIMLHGGASRVVRHKFARLSKPEQADVIAFLKSLKVAQ